MPLLPCSIAGCPLPLPNVVRTRHATVGVRYDFRLSSFSTVFHIFFSRPSGTPPQDVGLQIARQTEIIRIYTMYNIYIKFIGSFACTTVKPIVSVLAGHVCPAHTKPCQKITTKIAETNRLTVKTALNPLRRTKRDNYVCLITRARTARCRGRYTASVRIILTTYASIIYVPPQRVHTKINA